MTAPHREPTDGAASRAALRLFLALLFVAVFLFTGSFESSDEVLMAATARAIAFDASLHFPEVYGQTYTSYGLGAPLAALPFVYVEAFLRRIGAIAQGADVSLLPLTNALLFALCGALAGLLAMRLARREGFPVGAPTVAGAALIATLCGPLLPASTTFYSELLAAAGLLLLAWVVMPRDAAPRALFVWAFVGALAAVLARVSLLPAVGLVLVWGLLAGGTWQRVAAGAGGLVIALVVRGLQNLALHGSFTGGGAYDTQDFSTPLFTGLFGLLLSPERGLLLFAPAVVVALVLYRPTDRATRSFRALAVGVVLVFLVIHARFWTWHGGWTMGPRFLLPAVALALPVVVLALLQCGRWPRTARWAFYASLAWGAWGALLYTTFSAIGWWNELWGFHRAEARWQFEPQLSLWANWPALWQDGALRPRLLAALFGGGSGGWRVPGLFLLLATLTLLVGMVLHARVVRRSFPARRALWCGVVVLGVGIWAVGAGGLLIGPRGWTVSDVYGERTVRFLRIYPGEGEFVRARALLDPPTHGTYTLHVKADGLYTIALDGAVVVAQSDPVPRHLAEHAWTVERPEPILAEIEFHSKPGEAGLLQLYWTLPGEGTVLQPLGGEYVLPRSLRPHEEGAVRIWRRRWIGLSGIVALLLLLEVSGVREKARRRPPVAESR